MSRQRTPLSPHQPKEGRWLCAEGPYLDLISKFSKLYPEINGPDPKNVHIGSRIGQSRSVLLELNRDITWSSKPFTNAGEIKQHFEAQSSHLDPSTEAHHRVYILEGLDPDYIEAYGSRFGMDPTFFIGQERNELWNVRNLESHINDLSGLPSAMSPEKQFRVKYREARQFGPHFNNWRTTCALTGRHISAIGFNGKLDTVGAVARRFSFWCGESSDGGWDVVMLCDPAIKNIHRPCRPPIRNRVQTEILESEPFQGGYSDFIKHTRIDLSNPPSLQAPPRLSLLDDICFYLENHYSTIVASNLPQAPILPLSAAIFPMQIICGHYMKLIDYFEVILYRIGQTEWQLSRQSDYADYDVPAAEEQWSSLQISRARLITYIDNVEEIIKDIDLSSSSCSAPHQGKSINTDLQYIHRRLQKMENRMDESIASAVGYSNIVGSQRALIEARRSVREAKRAKTLTVVGLIFIPLAYTCGLFSMSDQFRPGQRLFWVYFAVSLPLIMLVFLGTFMIQLGYDKDGTEWSFRQFQVSLKEKIL